MSEDKKRKQSIFRRVKRDNITDKPKNAASRNADLGYSAFTTPVENDYSPYSPQTLSVPPPSNDNVENTKEKKAGLARYFAIGLVALALIVISSFATYLFSHYDFQLSSGNGVIKFSLLPKIGNSPQQKEQDQNQNQQQNVPPDSSNSVPVPSNTPSQSVQNFSKWDGTTMNVGTQANSYNELSLQQIYKKCVPSVVAVHSESQDGVQNGAGILISANGYIVTNQHITYGANLLAVTLENGNKYSAALVGEDDQTDISVIKIDASGLTPAEFSDFQDLEVGDKVVTIGNVLNQSLSMTDGIITAINRNVNFNGFSITLLQTNATINSGNSGGPLINMSGQVIGITNAALVSASAAVRGIGFAVPASAARPIINAIMKDGYVKGRPSLGLRLSDIAISAYAYYKLPKGVYVNRVYTNSDAFAKGVQPGDVICAVNNNPVGSLSDIIGIINTFPVGETVKIKLFRNGSYITLDVKLIDKAELN